MSKNKRSFLYIILSTIILLLIGILIYNKFSFKEYSSTLYYLDTYINIKFYTNNRELANETLKEVEKIYIKYDQLTDRYNSYDGINNLYYIRNNFSKDEYIILDNELYNLIQYGKDVYKTTNGKIDISLGNVTDLWKTYRETKIGIPNLEELKIINNQSIDDIVLKENNMILNNHINIDLEMIVKGYVTKEVEEYLKKQNLDKYFINTGGTIALGNSYQKEYYKVALQSPNSENEILKILKIKNKVISTTSSIEKYYDYENVRYHHIIDSNTLYPSNYVKSVTVIADDINYANMLSTMLFLMNYQDGLKYVETIDNIEVIWVLNDNSVITSSGISEYE